MSEVNVKSGTGGSIDEVLDRLHAYMPMTGALGKVNPIGPLPRSWHGVYFKAEDVQKLLAALLTRRDQGKAEDIQFLDQLENKLAATRRDAPQEHQEAGPQAWKAAFYRLGRVLNMEAREHGEIVEALGMGYDIATMEDDEQFHARVLAKICELKHAAVVERDDSECTREASEGYSWEKTSAVDGHPDDVHMAGIGGAGITKTRVASADETMFTSECTHPEFETWFKTYGEALIGKMSYFDLMLAAWAVSEDRCKRRLGRDAPQEPHK